VFSRSRAEKQRGTTYQLSAREISVAIARICSKMHPKDEGRVNAPEQARLSETSLDAYRIFSLARAASLNVY
jgi:hypothetical protein